MPTAIIPPNIGPVWTGQDVPAGHQDGVADRFSGSVLAAAGAESAISGSQVGVFGADGRHGGNSEVPLQPAVTVAGGAVLLLAG
jgi:hypothetical protein